MLNNSLGRNRETQVWQIIERCAALSRVWCQRDLVYLKRCWRKGAKLSSICTIGIFGATGTIGTSIGGGEAEVIPFQGFRRQRCPIVAFRWSRNIWTGHFNIFKQHWFWLVSRIIMNIRPPSSECHVVMNHHEPTVILHQECFILATETHNIDFCNLFVFYPLTLWLWLYLSNT